MPKDFIIDAWQRFKCTSLGATFLEGLFCFKIAGGVSTTLFGELCHRLLFGNFAKIFQNSYFPKFLATASDVTRNYWFVSHFPAQFLVKCNKFCINFAHDFWALFDHKWFRDLEITKFWFKDRVAVWWI